MENVFRNSKPNEFLCKALKLWFIKCSLSAFHDNKLLRLANFDFQLL